MICILHIHFRMVLPPRKPFSRNLTTQSVRSAKNMKEEPNYLSLSLYLYLSLYFWSPAKNRKENPVKSPPNYLYLSLYFMCLFSLFVFVFASVFVCVFVFLITCKEHEGEPSEKPKSATKLGQKGLKRVELHLRHFCYRTDNEIVDKTRPMLILISSPRFWSEGIFQQDCQKRSLNTSWFYLGQNSHVLRVKCDPEMISNVKYMILNVRNTILSKYKLLNMPTLTHSSPH